jgi:cytochrome c oxidase subunit II
MPIVAPPPGQRRLPDGDERSSGRRSSSCEKDAEYTLHLSALDVNHGFNLYPLNVNFQVVPGYDYGLRVTPTRPATSASSATSSAASAIT